MYGDVSAMNRNDRPPLPPWINDAYERLAAEIRHRDGGLTTDRAREHLQTEGLIDGREDARYALTRLLNRGYLYQVDDELFVTEPESDPDDDGSST